MRNYQKHLYIAATFVILGTAVVFSSIHTGHSETVAERDVRVINTTTEPVPTVAQGMTAIAGNVSVTNIPAVKAQPLGPWSVDIANSPTVKVGNTQTNPVLVRDVDHPARQPLQITAHQPFDSPLVTLPAGKRRVVEFVSGIVRTPARVRPQLELQLSGPSTGISHLIALLSWPNDANLFQFSQPLRLYAEPGDSLIVKSVDSSIATVHVTGPFVDVP